MRFLQLRLQQFRNIDFAELDLSSSRSFLLGANGQGKSNLLEALGLITALRSFRTQSLTALPQQGGPGYAVVYSVEHEQQGRTEVELQSARAGRTVSVDGEKISRLGDFIGRFPVVPLSSGDLMLLRGSPTERRRFLDLTLSAVDPAYYHALRRYHRGVAERNRLLKQNGSAAELSAFEAEIAPQAVALARRREQGFEALRRVLTCVYEGIAEADEGPEMVFQASDSCESEDAVAAMLRNSRKRDAIVGSTQKGPHRDDFALRLRVGGAREYASDGQQRGLCVALRIAQARFFHERLGVQPVILADDVLGELDPHRKAGFWKACPEDFQIIATGTELPDRPESWSVWQVRQGAFAPLMP
ncbi:DNA replication/repair protein RecF [Coraliomargarita parva]|uniref:DNA replication/repair protein RecF n=1 Tax=Coraliomargarita parva TaxID=3014050 RepID=UPI0022B5C415|nr:DNA replication and repair protein RecF [Coraliomargarita parva]